MCIRDSFGAAHRFGELSRRIVQQGAEFAAFAGQQQGLGGGVGVRRAAAQLLEGFLQALFEGIGVGLAEMHQAQACLLYTSFRAHAPQQPAPALDQAILAAARRQAAHVEPARSWWRRWLEASRRPRWQAAFASLLGVALVLGLVSHNVLDDAERQARPEVAFSDCLLYTSQASSWSQFITPRAISSASLLRPILTIAFFLWVLMVDTLRMVRWAISLTVSPRARRR